MPKEILKCNFGMGTGKKGSEMLRAKTEGVKEYRMYMQQRGEGLFYDKFGWRLSFIFPNKLNFVRYDSLIAPRLDRLMLPMRPSGCHPMPIEMLEMLLRRDCLRGIVPVRFSSDAMSLTNKTKYY